MMNEYIERFWRDATAADVVRVMNGEVVEARFFDKTRPDANRSKLFGWINPLWVDTHGLRWNYCQVYDPPQYWLDKPEPGEGYRLLAKSPDEPVQGGDFAWFEKSGWITLNHGCEPDQQEGYWYRRRIDPPKPEPKYKVGQRVKIIGPPIKGEGPIYNWCVEMDKFIGVVEFVRSQPQQTFEGVFHQVSNIANWSFREDYLEPVVEPEPQHYTLAIGDTVETLSGLRLTVTEHGVEVT